MMAERFDLCVIGGGAGGLVTAGGAAQLGAHVLLIDDNRLGGECLWSGCVPSKALLHIASVARVRGGIDWREARRHVDAAIAAIAPHDAPERFEAWGVEVLQARAVFIGRDRVEAAGRTIAARRFVVATGSAPLIPPVPGLAAIPFLTNESVFALDALPPRLLILGGGAIGVELAQAFARLGAQVTIIEQETLLGAADAEAVTLVRASLEADGVAVHDRAKVARADLTSNGDGVALQLASGEALSGSHFLVAAGRAPRVAGFGLDAAGVAASAKGIVVDKYLRTSNPRIFAVGDCRDGPRFTHAADQDARAVIANALFPRPLWRASTYDALPSVAYTDPEVAQVGLTEAVARQRFPDIAVHRIDLDHNDRAVTQGASAGFVKLMVRRDRVVGATIAGPHAGEILPLARLAVTGKLSLATIAAQTFAYPTLAEAFKAAAELPGQAKLFTPTMRRITRWFQRLP